MSLRTEARDDFQSLLREALALCGSVAALSRALKVSRKTIDYWVSGTSSPRITNILRLKKIVGAKKW